MEKTNELGTGKVSSLLLNLAVPAIIAMLVSMLYNMVDRIYIGNMENGTIGMAGLAVAVPIITLIQAFTQLFGTGGAPLAAIRLGEQKKEEAERIMAASFISLVVSGILLTTIIEIFQEPILLLFGADETSLASAKEYVTIYALGTVFVQIAQGMNPYINTQGFAKMGMATILIGAVLNIILDPIFIFAMGMGIRGAAVATILSQGISALWVMYFLLKRSPMKLRRAFLVPRPAIIGAIITLGISPFVMSGTEGLLQISFNNQLSAYGGSIAVGSMAILLSLYQMILLPLGGITQGAQPILSYNFGARDLERVRETFRLSFRVCLLYSFTISGIIMIFAPAFARIFSRDADTIRYAVWAIRIYISGGLFFGAQISCQQSFMALGQAKRSLCMALLRKVILLIPLIYLLPVLLGDLGLAQSMAGPVADLLKDGGKTFCVLFAEPVSDILAASITSLTFFSFYRKSLR
ncbi:MAG: MATE family efflux transporter [Lachnospiraceae bacterium]|jgi:putative MATE family efflux protein|nr:MATE family efflux transporter [Lachnospiraceae bacterium]